MPVKATYKKIWQPQSSLKKTKDLFEEVLQTKKALYSSFDLYFEDESRFGLFTRNGRALTARGVKPICPYLHKFENLYLFGAFSPVSGNSLLLEMPYCNSDTFEVFLNHLSALNKETFNIVVLDNGAFHKAKRLVIPDNIGLLFLPAYSPELNPAEQIWRILKKTICNKVFKTLDELSAHLSSVIKNIITPDSIKSITGYDSYLSAYQTIYDL
ncbi:IS630 family transposase [Ilyomonas limi]|uniref:IS630 family transposase n=1 Tax=Ilyomonas limi TaxID=2575867 RepID=A0A4U3KP67_9BACT|nr:IS630 family transposase [Ilyomonas limi]TKK63930.1 IS630 family transposase [Ilyomonas limi]